MKYFNKKIISIPLQYSKLTNKFSGIIVEKQISVNGFYLVLNMKPFENSLDYRVLFFQERNKKPKTYILSPNIYELTNGKEPPHVYEFNESLCRLCLNLPSEVDTNKYYDYVIPWISDWLAYFEMWLITGEWYGGGHESEKVINKD